MPYSTLSSVNHNSFLSRANITAASFSSPSSNGSITIGSITGNFTSITVTRTGGTQGTFTDVKTMTNSGSYTDPTTLTANVQYTYVIYPMGGVGIGRPFTNIINPNNGSTPGKIYTLVRVPTEPNY